MATSTTMTTAVTISVMWYGVEKARTDGMERRDDCWVLGSGLGYL